MPGKRSLILTALVALLIPASAVTPANSADSGSSGRSSFRVLVFSKTTGFRHDSIPDGIVAIQKLGRQNGFAVDTTEDATRFTDRNLARYRAVVFLSSTGDPLGEPAQKEAFERYIERGGGFAGVHAAADSGYEWPWYGGLVGAYFRSHPEQQNATVVVTGRGAPSSRGLPRRWTRFDEWYNYQTNPRADGVRVLMTLDERSYDVGPDAMGDHPIAWCHRYDGGRAWYTGLGHTKESYTDPLFLNHLLGGIEMAAGAAAFPCGADNSGGA